MVKNLISAGFVASHLADLLLSKNEEVYVYHRWSDDISSFNHIKNKVNWCLMDLNDLSSCIKVIDEVRPDYIYHLGAQSSVTASFAYPAVTLQTNGVGTLNLLEAVRIVRDNVNENFIKYEEAYLDFDPVIHVCSSSEVYGVVKNEDLPIKETQPFNPANPYAVSKITEDMLALMYYTNYKLKIIRTRFFTHTGPRRTMMSAECFYAKWIAQAEKQQEQTKEFSDLELTQVCKIGNLYSIRTFADVRDAVRAYYLLARSEKYGEVFNVAGNTVKSIKEVLDYLLSISRLDKNKVKLEVDPKLLRPYDVQKQTVDISKLKNTIDWKPEIPFEQTIQDLLNWWRENV